MTYIPVKDLPDVLQRALKSVDYNRKDVSVIAKDEVQPLSSGDQGSRGYVIVVNLETGELNTQLGSWGGPNPFEKKMVDDPDIKPVKLIPNMAIILGVTGYYKTATIYVASETLAPLLPAAQPLTDEEARALYCHKAIKGGQYRRDCFHEHKVSPETIENLVSRGFLKKDVRGFTQITTSGKNALEAAHPGIWQPIQLRHRFDESRIRKIIQKVIKEQKINNWRKNNNVER